MKKKQKTKPLTEREQRLINARRACLALVPLFDPDSTAAVLVLSKTQHGEAIADLVEEFTRLDCGEIARRKAGQAQGEHGKKGGRPPKAVTDASAA